MYLKPLERQIIPPIKMFSGLASYIWGPASTEEEQSQVTEPSPPSTTTQNPQDDNDLSEEQADDHEWVLVEKSALGWYKCFI